ncbi:MAG TPA: DJ-1/PfpI family protein [Candidatus Polarisedimenticolaceae bacterium]|nr:DJ-1/PfpI family protein [Candidatus Polarisedimenticolaceae bacterium]
MSQRIFVAVAPDVHLLDLAGPVQVFYEANGFGADYEIVHCAATTKVTSAQGLVLSELAPLPKLEAGDTVLVPGLDSRVLHKARAIPGKWLRDGAAAGARIASICSGAFSLAAAGLLDGRECTTHWKITERLQREFPEAHVAENRLFVKDGNVVTSAGVASGIDMALSLVMDDHGPAVVAKVAREMVVYLRRSGEREQVSPYLDYRTHLHDGVHRVQDFVVTYPHKNPSLSELARVAAMSPRNLTRHFREATGITIKTYSGRVKVQLAQDLLRNPRLTLESVSESCGFKDPRQFRRLWKQTMGGNPSQWRHDTSRLDAR